MDPGNAGSSGLRRCCRLKKMNSKCGFRLMRGNRRLGRGLGTYSMKLLSERYLEGCVGFTSSAKHGTTFTARYPLDQNPQRTAAYKG